MARTDRGVPSQDGRDAFAVLDLESAKVRRRLFRTLIFLAAVVFTVTFALSWDALAQLARASYIDPRLSYVFPLAVDALAITAFISGILLARHRLYVRLVPAAVTVLFAALSVIGNGLHAYSRGGQLHISQTVAIAVSAIPPVSGMVMIHLFALLLRHLVSKQAAPALAGYEVEREPVRAPIAAPVDVPAVADAPAAPLQIAEGADRKRLAFAWLDDQHARGELLSRPGFNAEMAHRFGVSVSQVEKWKRAHRDGDGGGRAITAGGRG